MHPRSAPDRRLELLPELRKAKGERLPAQPTLDTHTLEDDDRCATSVKQKFNNNSALVPAVHQRESRAMPRKLVLWLAQRGRQALLRRNLSSEISVSVTAVRQALKALAQPSMSSTLQRRSAEASRAAPIPVAPKPPKAMESLVLYDPVTMFEYSQPLVPQYVFRFKRWPRSRRGTTMPSNQAEQRRLAVGSGPVTWQTIERELVGSHRLRNPLLAGTVSGLFQSYE